MEDNEILEIRTGSAGRYTVARRSFERGQTVLSEMAFEVALFEDCVPEYCDWTLLKQKGLMICSRSKFARYSSRESQKAAWKQYYKYECKAHEKYSPKVPPTLLRLAARLLWRAEEEFQSKPADQATLPTTKYDFHAWQTLFKGFDECTTSQRIAFGQMAMLCFMFFRAGEKRRPEEDGSWSMGLPAMPPAHCRGGYTWPAPDIPAIHAGEIQHLLSALSVNCHTVCDEEQMPIGLGLFPRAALVNHSCTPNCFAAFHGRRIRLVAVKDIQPGDEITISYCDVSLPAALRRRELIKSHLFDLAPSLPRYPPRAFTVTTFQEPSAEDLRRALDRPLEGLARWRSRGPIEVHSHCDLCLSDLVPADPRDAELLRADIIPDAERSRQRPSACWVVPLPPYTPLMKGAAHSDMGGFDAGPDPGCALEVHVFPRFSEESPDGGTGLPRARNSDLEEVGRIVALIWTFMAASNVCMKAGDREGAFQLHRAAIEAMDKGSTSSAVMRCPRSYGQMSVCTPAWNAEEEDPDAELDSSERTMAAMFKRHAMGEKFYLRLDLARGMAESAMEMGNMDLALENVREVSSMLRHMTPERWPPTGLQLLLQGRMETDPAVALKLFREAMETLGAVVPVDGSIARELRESLVHYQREVQKA